MELFFIVFTVLYITNSPFFINATRANAPCNIFKLNISNTFYEACVETEDVLSNNMVNGDTKLIVQNGKKNQTYSLEKLELNFVKGYILTKPYTSSVSGFVDNNHFSGRIQIDSKIYYVEEINADLIQQTVRKQYNLDQYNNVHPKKNLNKTIPRAYNVFNYKSQYLKQKTPTGKVCSLLIFIDNSFLRIIGKNSIKASVSTVLHSLDEINSIFRSTDFNNDSVPDNIGFKVKYIVVIESEEYENKILPPYTMNPINGRIYLFMWSRHKLLPEVCLGAAFTAQPFIHHALGLSYTAIKDMPSLQKPNVGGICERPTRLGFGECYNTLVITYCLENGKRIPKKFADLSLAHELGHSFGSDHDENSPCYGHLMAPRTPNIMTTTKANFIFSECSKKQIFNVIKNKGHCLEDTFDTYCGNGLVEEDEDCDCGLQIDCITNDLCCTQKNNLHPPCKVNKAAGYECHPSQGLCCGSNCKYKNISFLHLDCSAIEKKCPCKNMQSNCDCGLLGQCVDNECHSKECTRINLLECRCPNNVSNGKCGTCCLNFSNNKCQSARKLTKMMSSNNSLLVKNLKQFKSDSETLSNNTIIEKVCYESTCVNVPFKYYNLGGFCVFKGALGICNKKSKCVVERPRKIFPSIRNVVVETKSGAPKFYFQQYVYLLLLYLFEILL